MFRFVVCAGLAFGMTGALTTPAAAQLSRKQTCLETAKIVQVASTLRANGTKKSNVERSLTKGNNKVEEPYVPMVPLLVDWVYTIDDGFVATPGAPKAIADKYRKDCLAFKG